MDVIAYLLPLALILGFVGLLAFMWTLKSGQYDDLDGTAWRAILDEDKDLIPHKAKRKEPSAPDNPQAPVDERCTTPAASPRQKESAGHTAKNE